MAASTDSSAAAEAPGRLFYDNLLKSITFVVSSNISEAAPFLALLAANVPLALTTSLILVSDCGTDIVPAISLV